MQALGEACCLQPMPYHFHQQQVKVLVHNPILPAFHHPFTSPMGPSIIEIPRETKPSALISPQRLPQIGPGTGDDNSQSQQQGQPAQVQSQQGLHSPQQPPQTGEKEPKGNFPPQEMPDNKTDIKEPVIGGNNEEDKKAPKRCHNGNGDKSIVCKTESDKKNSSEPSVKSVKLSKENIKATNPSVSTVSDGKVAVESEGNLSGKKSNKNESHNSDSDKEKSQADKSKRKKSKEGERAKKKKQKPLEGVQKDENSVKKKKKKKKDGAVVDVEIKKKKKDGAVVDGEIKKKKKDGAVVDGENPGKPKKIKKKKKKHNPDAIANGTTSTATAGDNPGKNPIANTDNKPKKKKKKSKEKSDGKSKKKKVVSSKKKLSSASNPEIPGKCQEKVSTT